MNKLKNIGLSALCGSLASISAANAGSIDVTGSALATYTTLGDQVTGNPLGMATGLTFTGNGELDGGQTFSVVIANTNKEAYSSSHIKLNTNSVGTFILSSAEGGQGIGGYDDNNHQAAWEEVWDTGVTTRANFQKGVSLTTNLSWTSPKFAGTTFQIAYTPENDGSQNDKKATSGGSTNFGAGWDVVLDTGTENGGINFFVGGSRTEIPKTRINRDLSGDHEEAVVGLSFKLGPVALGGQVSGERTRARAVNTAEYYGNSSWGVAFNVNDSLSVSYSEARHLMTKTHKKNHGNGELLLSNFNEYTPKSWMRGDSVQIAYTVGGLGLKFARTTYDNTLFTFDKKVPRESQIVALSLAF